LFRHYETFEKCLPLARLARQAGRFRPEKHIFYFSLGRIEDYNQLYELIDCYLRNVRPYNQQRLYIFLDEISFVRQWQRGIKAMADGRKLKNVTLLPAGSNLIDIRGGAERMPGRRGKLSKVDFEQLPMTFAEFLHLKVSAADFQWFKKISPKGRRLSVITKQDFQEHQSISLIPAPVFPVQLGNQQNQGVA